MKRVWFLSLLFLFPNFLHAQILPRGFQEEIVAYGLKLPTAAEFAPDGRLFILEKQGRIRIVKDGRLLPKPLLTLKVNALYERGLLGLAFDPDFDRTHFIYVYRTTDANNPKNVVERYTVNGDLANPGSRKLLLGGIRSDSGIHNAGCLRFGPDGKLYISTGEAGLDPNLAQDLSSLNGKILRINRDGSVPADNPFVNRTGARPEIWCYGFRNPWRFAIDPASGLLVIGDVGGDLYEEVNIGRPGANYGWPLAEGPSDNPSLTPPVYTYDHSKGGAAVVIGNFYTDKKYPAKFRNRLFVTDYARNFIKTFAFDQDGGLVSVSKFAVDIPAPVHLVQAPDGSMLHVSIHAGEIRRMHYVGGTNRPPVVFVKYQINSGLAPLKVKFTSSGTFDPDHNPLTYQWDFGDGTISAAENPDHTYKNNGSYFVLLTVEDGKGGITSSRSLKIVVGNLPPHAVILSPANGTVVHNGELIHFSGTGSDPEDGAIDPNNMIWSAKLYHNDHTHPALNGVIGPEGTLPVPPTFHDTGTLFFRLKLRVVDSEGLSDSTYVDLPWQQ